MIFYHYTTEANMQAIVYSCLLRPSRARPRTKDVRYGNGQYLSDVGPGTLSPAQLSRLLVGLPYLGHRFTHYVAIDLFDLKVVCCRPGVFLVPNDFALCLRGRIVDFGRNCCE